MYIRKKIHTTNSKKRTSQYSGFTLIELLIVVAIVGILYAIVLSSLQKQRDNAYKSTTKDSFNQMNIALQQYLNQSNGVYPPDVARDLPAEIKEYLGKNDSDEWPSAPWPGSVFDWDNWDIGGQRVVQISVRFCPAGGPLSACRFPNEPWAANFGVNSAYYYCIEGACRSHSSEPITYPGYCVNCAVQPSGN
jgi:prepilin-type N-terminal cleavage/methylation domain-containing protein